MLEELADHLVDEVLAEMHRHLERGATQDMAVHQAFAYVERKLENALDIAADRIAEALRENH
jgi:hypothetical protein